MLEMIEANWLVFGAALLAVLLVGWWLLRRGSTPARREHRPDVLDEGQAPAARNQALIDAAPAAQVVLPPTVSDALGGLGEIVAVTAQDEVEEVEARAAEMEVVPEVEEPAPPSAQAEPVEAPAPPAGADDLSRIKGLGPKLQALLPTLGLSTYAQIAALSEADLDALDGQLGPFAGRPRKDSWVEQARLLAAGDVAGFEGKFGKV